jgi:uncharacterized cofD-like protein
MPSSAVPKNRIRVVTIGGGSGQFALLSGLRDIEQIAVTAVVSMMDSGGSTGRLRDELGILPPGDILKCILALSPHQEIARAILLKRFKGDRRLKGHNAGNMLLTMLSQYTGSFPTGVSALAEILESKGVILPVTTDQATLVAELTDGTRIYGEKAIDIPRGNQREKIKDVFLVPHHHEAIHVYPPVVQAIGDADFILLGPGDLFTSIIPNLIVPGVSEALRGTKAPLLYLINIMTKYGETNNFRGIDFVQSLENSMQRRINGIIYNNSQPSENVCAIYAEQKSECVLIDADDDCWEDRKLYGYDLIDQSSQVMRHDAKKLACLLESIFRGTAK